MKKYLYLTSLIVAVAAVFLLSSPAHVSALAVEPPVKPANGNWIWDDTDVTGTIIPQYQLAETYDPDYAVLQSQGLHISGPAQICHPYRGGQFGWNAEIRVLTNTGWQQVPTVNEWVPDEEGQYMTCAQAWYSGTYAVFGYWEKPDGWMAGLCPTVPANYDTLVFSLSELISMLPLIPEMPIFDIRCAVPTDIGYVAGGLYMFVEGEIEFVMPLAPQGLYCGCESIYADSSFSLPPAD